MKREGRPSPARATDPFRVRGVVNDQYLWNFHGPLMGHSILSSRLYFENLTKACRCTLALVSKPTLLGNILMNLANFIFQVKGLTAYWVRKI